MRKGSPVGRSTKKGESPFSLEFSIGSSIGSWIGGLSHHTMHR